MRKGCCSLVLSLHKLARRGCNRNCIREPRKGLPALAQELLHRLHSGLDRTGLMLIDHAKAFHWQCV